MDSNNSAYTIYRLIVRLNSFMDEIDTNQSLKKKLIIEQVIIMIIVMVGSFLLEANIFDKVLFILAALLLWLILLIFEIYFYGHGFSNRKFEKGFQKIGLKNKLIEYPILKSKYISSKRKAVYTFYSSGIPKEVWDDNMLNLENVFNISISEIRIGGRNDIIIVKCFRGKFDWNSSILWSNDYIPAKDNLVIGNTITGLEYLDINSFPHILIGGMTGSGKTILLKQLLLQCIAKNYNVYIADFKFGVDYPSSWKKRCPFLTSRDEIIANLKEITVEMESRQNLMSATGCNNIRAYNDKFNKKLERIIFACDELAELLNTTGMDKNEKAQIKEIEGYISKIARLGRASGIHLILATQRPDADILNGQIKSNMTYRLCGRANEVLSRIILDTTDAAKLIPGESKGVFINQDGIRVKGFYVKDDDIKII